VDEQILKGNFKVKNPIKIDQEQKPSSFQEEYKKRALASIGGSMVYMERTNLTWDGDK
jgi:hypothetical protein